MLRTEQPFILIEILPLDNSEKNLMKNARLENLFNDLDYLLYRIEKNREQFSHLTLLTKIGPNIDPTGWDYLAIPSDMQETLSASFLS